MVESCDVILLELKRSGCEVTVEQSELKASLQQMLKYLDEGKDYYN